VRDRLARLLFERGGLLVLATLGLYVWLAPRYVVDGDNAEFATLGLTGGAAHPSGYPLYVLYLRAMQWIPSASPAHTAALATALVSAASIGMLHAACRAWGARAVAATAACGIFAAGPIVLRMYSEAEVFSLNGLIVATILWLAAPGSPVRGRRRVLLLALTAGLGMANHLSCTLTAPVGIYGVVIGLREHRGQGGRRWPIVLGAAGLFVAGLTPYLYLYLAPHTPASWGHLDSLSAVVRHFLREDYGGPGAFGPKGSHVPALTSIAALAENALRGWLWLPVVFGVAMLGLGSVRGPHKVAWWCLTAAIVIAGPLLASRFNIPPKPGLQLYVCQRFYLLPMGLLAVPIAVGFDRAWQWVEARRGALRLRPSVLAALGLAPLALAVGLSLPHQRRAHSPAVERALEMMLRTAPPNAVLLTSADHFDLVGSYAQFALGMRPDVVMANGGMMTARWYLADLSADLGFDSIPDGPGLKSERFAKAILDHGRPLLVDHNFLNIATKYASYPYGILVRIVPPGDAAPSVDEVFELNKKIFESIDFNYPAPYQTDDWPAQIHYDYANTWELLAQALEAKGRPEDAKWALDLAYGLAPR
jgi:hypothetical protein